MELILNNDNEKARSYSYKNKNQKKIKSLKKDLIMINLKKKIKKEKIHFFKEKMK